VAIKRWEEADVEREDYKEEGRVPVSESNALAQVVCAEGGEEGRLGSSKEKRANVQPRTWVVTPHGKKIPREGSMGPPHPAGGGKAKTTLRKKREVFTKWMKSEKSTANHADRIKLN